jgi:hypothetical protein
VFGKCEDCGKNGWNEAGGNPTEFLTMYDTILGIAMGLGLAAACGFRVFVPLTVLAVAHRAGAVDLGHGTAWLGSDAALIALGTATLLEIVAYWVPWLDHALDVVAAPAAVIAGTLAAGSQLADLGPMLQWGSALIAGGGMAAAAKTTSIATRATSTVATAGVGNPVISTIESAAAAVLSVVAIVAPIVAGLILLALLSVVGWWLVRRRRRRTLTAAAV